MARDASKIGRRAQPLRVLYVYHGTAGVAGAYLHGVARALEGAEAIECHLATSSYYEFLEDSARTKTFAVFFPCSEDTPRNRLRRLPGFRTARRPVRYLELALGYAALLPYLVLHGIDVVNLSVIDDELPTWLFALAVKGVGRRLHVTAHDVVHTGARSSPSRRRRILSLANRVIVHYPHVKAELESRLGVAGDRIVVHPFPWEMAPELVAQGEAAKAAAGLLRDVPSKRRIVLLPGVLRAEKGVDLLLRAWSLARLGDGVHLVIAGKPTGAPDVRALAAGCANVTVIDRYLDSEELIGLLDRADAVALPYSAHWYAHSSMVLLALERRKRIIASKIPLFQAVLGAEFAGFHQVGDAGDLARALRDWSTALTSDSNGFCAQGHQRLGELTAGLEPALKALYRDERTVVGSRP